jgi:hypothetical protein
MQITRHYKDCGGQTMFTGASISGKLAKRIGQPQIKILRKQHIHAKGPRQRKKFR